MLTTTPFFNPRDGCVPMPMTLSAPSAVISATIAAIFDVPMSRPTIRFFSFTIRLPPSLGIFGCASGSRFLDRLLAKAGYPHGKSVAITQVHLLDVTARSGERGDCAIVRGDEAREASAGIVTPELDRQRTLPIGRADFPTAARRKRQSLYRQSERRQQRGPFAIARGNRGGVTIRSVELRQIAVPISGEHFAVRVDQRGVVPTCQRCMLDHIDL